MSKGETACATQIPDELIHLAPYYHDIDLGDGRSTAPGSSRIADTVDLLFPPLLRFCGGSLEGKRVLDLGCNCGGLAFAAARFGAAEVVGIDARDIHIRQARCVQEYLGLSSSSFHQDLVENLTPEKYGQFDICLASGILYHLSDPIGVMARIAEVTTEIVVVDSHVHYSSVPELEDTPSWWMLADSDIGDHDGLRQGDRRLSIDAYAAFESENGVDYGLLRHQFWPSPHTARDIEFSRRLRAEPAPIPTEDSLASSEMGALVLVPNQRALVRLLRYGGFEDVLTVVPHRFAPEPYLRKYRVGLFGLKRPANSSFRQSVWAARAAAGARSS